MGDHGELLPHGKATSLSLTENKDLSGPRDRTGVALGVADLP